MGFAVVRRFIIVVGLIAFAAGPALADAALDAQCKGNSDVASGIGKSCVAASPEDSAAIKRCLASHVGAFRPTASTCIQAAQDHFDAAYNDHGYAADVELGLAGIELQAAAMANAYSSHYDLAIQQAKSAQSIFTRILKDPEAKDLTRSATEELRLSKLVESLVQLLR